MRILVIGINYAPEEISVGPFTAGLCEALAGAGHQVSVITAFPYYPQWRVWDAYRGSLYRREQIRGVNVKRIAHFIPHKASNLFQRLVYDLSFTLNSLIVGLFSGKCDLIYCSCPPPTVALGAWILAGIKGVPHVIKLTDLASDAALATGIMQEGMLTRTARMLEKFMYDRADGIVCLCQGFVDRLRSQGVDMSKVDLIPDWGDTESVFPVPADTAFRAVNRLPLDKLVVLHSGNMGKKQNLINVIKAADISRHDPNIMWVLVGDGEERCFLKSEIDRRKLENVRILPLQPRETLGEMYAAADILLLNQTAAMKDAVIPSKLLTYMAAGRCILAAANIQSQAARIIQDSDCGRVVPAEDPNALVEALQTLRQSPSAMSENGRNGRTYALQHFTKARVLNQYAALFQRWDPEIGRVAIPSASN